MARNFRRNRTTHPIADLNVTNLIDLGFILLIIFMVASSVMKQEQTVPVELPMESVSAQQKSDPKERSESITVMPDGGVLLGDRPLTIRQLADQLVRKSTAQQFVAVMDELKKHNLVKISFDTQIPH